ncbi:hypothetical protein B0F90DRAFT_393912 [Multifurca ochricompacta]|uniref:Uncharacterized protein n=1 Tax=Multifurca ochricompacta TaxID=376703 RepID=A0AAD4QM49_9AGAM|nr:hypothetical protein B0F90DRAFT_393912 [Multifurca ochricompacta]
MNVTRSKRVLDRQLVSSFPLSLLLRVAGRDHGTRRHVVKKKKREREKINKKCGGGGRVVLIRIYHYHYHYHLPPPPPPSPIQTIFFLNRHCCCCCCCWCPELFFCNVTSQARGKIEMYQERAHTSSRSSRREVVTGAVKPKVVGESSSSGV